MYCKKCGRKLKDEKTYCTYCGQGREEDVPISEEEKKKNPAANVNYKSIGVLCIILSVFIPIIGLILAIIYLATMKNNKDMEEKENGKRLLIVSIIIALAWILIPMIIGIGSLIMSCLFK